MPTKNQVHKNKPLENLSVAYRVGGLICDELLPRMMVQHESDDYFVYTKDNLRLDTTLRADGAESNETDWNLSTASYSVDFHALKHLVTDRVRNNADAAIKPDMDATESLTGKILLRKESDLASLLGTAANWANATSLTTTFAWSAQTSLSNPISFCDSATTVILQSAGVKANVMALDHRTWKAAKEHPSVIDRLKYTSSQSVGPDLLARLCGIERVLVADANINNGGEGLADSMGFLYTDAAWIGYINPAPGLRKLTAIQQFVAAGNGAGTSVTKWREEKRKGDFIEVETNYDLKVVASDCAYIIVNTVQ